MKIVRKEINSHGHDYDHFRVKILGKMVPCDFDARLGRSFVHDFMTDLLDLHGGHYPTCPNGCHMMEINALEDGTVRSSRWRRIIDKEEEWASLSVYDDEPMAFGTYPFTPCGERHLLCNERPVIYEVPPAALEPLDLHGKRRHPNKGVFSVPLRGARGLRYQGMSPSPVRLPIEIESYGSTGAILQGPDGGLMYMYNAAREVPDIEEALRQFTKGYVWQCPNRCHTLVPSLHGGAFLHWHVLLIPIRSLLRNNFHPMSPRMEPGGASDFICKASNLLIIEGGRVVRPIHTEEIALP